MNDAPRPAILVSEVGPRDGLQSIRRTMATDDKLRWITALHAAGLREIEVGSFVPAALLPQMADVHDVVRHALTLPGLHVAALAPNLRGAQAAFECGVHKLTVPISVTEAHSLANVRKTREQAIAELASIMALKRERFPDVSVEAGMSVAFGCTIAGRVDDDETLRMCERAADVGADEIGLSDTSGYAEPRQVRRLFRALQAAVGKRAGGAHFHNTRGQGLANVVAAIDVDVTTFDASQGGLGGCPYAPGASGNIVTEDLVFLLEGMGHDTGIDLVRLAAARAALQAGLEGEPLYGMVAEAGLPKGFRYARGRMSAPGRPKGEYPRAPPEGAPVSSTAAALPLAGIRVVEFTHMVMGPTCGMILADLGAEVIKVEPLQGDSTRRLLGSGAGFFPTFNRNKKSIAVDTKDARGREIVLRLVATADVFSENFKNGAMDKLGFDCAALSKLNERLIYVAHKGFLPGPYEHRTALDEVVQMMGGLAYMTGPEGRPLRAGASVNDIMGGMFGAIGVLAALRSREATGRGQEVVASLFENNVLLMAAHMMQFAVTGKPAAPMPSRISAWGIYDVFTVAGGEQIFLAVVSDTQWAIFCERFGFNDLAQDTRLATNNQRVTQRVWMMPLLRERLASRTAAELAAAFEAAGLPYAPIRAPHELFDDPHLRASGGLAAMQLPDGRQVTTPLLPVTLDGQRPGVRRGPPRLGEDTDAVLAAIGYDEREIAQARSAGVVG